MEKYDVLHKLVNLQNVRLCELDQITRMEYNGTAI